MVEDFSNRKTANAKLTVFQFSIKSAGILHFIKCSQEEMISLATAESGSHSFCHCRHKRRVEVAGVFGTNVLTAHTADANIFIGLAGIGFVDRSHRTTGSTNAAIIASIIGFRLERNVGKFLVCAMTSGKVQLSENTAIEFGRNFAGKFDQFLVIISSNPIGKEGRQKNQTGLNFGEIR